MGNHSTKSSQNFNRDHRPKKNVHWKSAEAPSNPGKPLQVAPVNNSAETLAIKWERPFTDGGSPIIGYLVEHRRIGSPNWVKTSATLVPFPEITMTGIEPNWRVQFRVFAQNVVGISESSPISEPISIITQHSGTSAPQFLNELQNTTVLENDQCEFHVSVMGSPTPQINWFKDGFEIFSSRRTKITNEHGSSTLIFHQIALTDEGEIKCTATNRYGHVVTRFQLRIDAPPKIRLPRQYEDGYLVEAGETIKLKVGIAGRPIPSISWSHNNEIITNGGRYEITTNDKNSFLKINKATRKDRGEFNVRAINKLGEFNASFLVTVTAKPSPPQNVRISMSLGKSVTLTWSAPEDDGGCKIGNYVVEYFRIGWDVWLKASSTRQLTTTLNDLIEGSEYKFRVKAESPYGLSEPSDESKIHFIPDPKRGIITPSSERNNRSIKPFTHSPNAGRKNLVYNQPRKSPIKQIVISDVPKNVEFISQIYDNEQIVKELSYGISIENRNAKRKDSLSDFKQNSDLNSIETNEIIVNNSELIESGRDSPNLSTVTTYLRSNSNEKETHGKFADDKNKLATTHDELHTSNEYMLVLYDDKNKEKQEYEGTLEENHFDLDLKEAIEAPPLSLSTPDLHDMSHHNPFQPLRRSASSSELLYEKVMQRFYQAVELDEAEMARKQNSSSIDPNSNRKSKSVERTMNSNDFESTIDNEAKGENLEPEPEQVPVTGPEPEPEPEPDQHDFDRDLRKEIYESQRKRSHTPREPLPDIQYDDDYTESTASSVGSVSLSASVESIEQFINSVRSASTNTNMNANTTNTRSPVNDELETYHPRMEMRALSPYRTPEPGQANVILNKPVALPDPDIKPKSILKRRPSNESSVNDTIASIVVETKPVVKGSQSDVAQPQMQSQSQSQSPPPTQSEPRPPTRHKSHPKSLPSTPKTEKEKRSFLNLFSKKATSAENLKKPVELPVESEKEPEKAVEKVSFAKQRQNSIEENKVEQVAVIDHYSDIVREMGGRSTKGKSTSPSPVPLYMNHQALREAAARAELEERATMARQNPSSRCISPESDKNNINDDENEQYLLEVARKMSQYTDSNDSIEQETATTTSQQNDLVEISVEHTKSVSYAVRQIKQPDGKAKDEAIFQANAKTLTESTKLINDDDSVDSVIDTKNQETLTKVRSSSRSRQLGRARILDRRSQSKSPISERKTSLSSTILKVTRMPVENTNNDIDIDLEPSPSSSRSPSPDSQCKTASEHLQSTAEENVRSTLSYVTDLAMFLLACYLYVFYDARLSIPILLLMIYRQMRNAFVDQIQKWTKRKRQ